MSGEKIEMGFDLKVDAETAVKIQQILDNMKAVHPFEGENDGGPIPQHIAFERITLLTVAIVITLKAYDQPLEAVIQNITTIWNGIEAWTVKKKGELN